MTDAKIATLAVRHRLGRGFRAKVDLGTDEATWWFIYVNPVNMWWVYEGVPMPLENNQGWQPQLEINQDARW